MKSGKGKRTGKGIETSRIVGAVQNVREERRRGGREKKGKEKPREEMKDEKTKEDKVRAGSQVNSTRIFFRLSNMRNVTLQMHIRFSILRKVHEAIRPHESRADC